MKTLQYIKQNFSFLILSSFFLFALLNPVFKKFDYGNGFPVVVGLGICLVPIIVFDLKGKFERSNLERSLLFVFAAFVALSFAFTEAKNIGFADFMAWLTMIPLYIYLAFKKHSWRDILLKVIFTGLVLSCLFGIYFYLTRPEMRLFGSFMNVWHRSNVWPNAFALFVLMAWPLSIYLFKKKLHPVYIGLLSIIGATFVLSFSRGALISMFGQLFLLAIFFRQKFNKKNIIVITSILIGVVFAFNSVNYLRSLGGDKANIDLGERISFAEGNTSTDERLDFWFASFDLIKEEPLLGHGPFTFRLAYNPIQRTFLGNSDHPHNLFLKVAVENGLPAAFVLHIFFLVVFITILTRFKDLNKKDKDLMIVLGVSLAGAFAHSLIDYNFNFVINLMTFFILIGIARSMVVKEKLFKPQKPIASLVLAISLALVLVYEGTLFAISYTVNPDMAAKSIYPRLYHVFEAEDQLKVGNFGEAKTLAEESIKLNPMDSEGYYFKALTHCQEISPYFDPKLCLENMKQAIDLNPMNHMKYYRDYFIALSRYSDTKSPEFKIFTERSLEMIDTYKDFVRYNTHYTALTRNVESTEALIDSMKPYLNSTRAKGLEAVKNQMILDKLYMRGGRTLEEIEGEH